MSKQPSKPRVEALVADACKQWCHEHHVRSRWRRHFGISLSGTELSTAAGIIIEHLQPAPQMLLLVREAIFGVEREFAKLFAALPGATSVYETPGILLQDALTEALQWVEAAMGIGLEFTLLIPGGRHTAVYNHHDVLTFYSNSPGRIAELRKALTKIGGVESDDLSPQP